jgi:hypothetical protein
MKFEDTNLSIRANRRSREGRGLEAIFSSQETGKERGVFTGATGVLIGLAFSILAILRINDPQALGSLSNVVYSSLAFGALGVLLLICGSGTLTFAFVHHKSEVSSSAHPPIAAPSDFDDLRDAVSNTQTQRLFGHESRLGGIAFVESLTLVALYSGFVQEFESNLTMQIWVRSNFPVGQSLLNWEGVFALSVVLGFLLLQFLPGRFLSEY